MTIGAERPEFRSEFQNCGTAPRQEEASKSTRGSIFVLALLLILTTVAIYYPIIHYPFINYDDNLYITDNPYVQSGLDRDTLQWAFTTFDTANWHPLTWLSHALDYQLFKLNPAGHHTVNLLLHVINVVLLFWVLWKATGYASRSLMVAALFALHPLNVQTVAWVSERKNLLSMLFFLLALAAYRWYAQKPHWTRYVTVAVLFALGLMAKPQVITLPFVLLLWDYWPLRRMFASADDPSSPRALAPGSFSQLLWEKLPLAVIALASAVVTMYAHRFGGAMKWFPLRLRLANAIVSYVRYLEKGFWPSRLALFYPHPGNSLTILQVSAALVFLLAVSGLVITERRRRYLVVGWLWFVGTLIPMIGIVQVGVQGMADRYAYLPLLGLFIMICWGVADQLSQRHVSTLWLAAGSIAVWLALAVVTHRQLGYWSDSVTLWSHTLEVTTGNYLAEDDLGGALLARGSPEEAMRHFRAAVALNPYDALGNLYIARYEHMQGHLPQAIEQYRKAVGMAEDRSIRSKALNELCHTYGELGDATHAWECYHAAAALTR